MKHINTILGSMLLATAAVATSCVDDDKLGYAFEKPASIEGMEYLADYDALKTYVDRNDHPNFKLGVALAAADYTANGLVTRLANSNYDEMTAGNAMKYASCVADDGSMDFGSVESFVNAAKENGMSIYGHTLAWHSQQNNKYLNSIIADKEIKVDPDAKNEVVDAMVDFSQYSKFPFYVMGYEPTFSDGMLHSSNPGDWYQYFVVDNYTRKAAETTITFMIKSSKDGSVGVQTGNWGATVSRNLTVSTEWEEQSVTFNDITTDACFVVLQPGTFDGDIDIKWVKVSHSEAPVMEFFVDQLTNGEMQNGKSMANFIVREKSKGDKEGTPIAGGPDGKNCIVIHSIANPEQSWDTQFFIYTPDKTWAGGEEYKISFWYKASAPIGCESQCHGAPGAYKHWQMLNPNPSFTTEWQYYEAKSTIPASGDGMQSIAFNLNVNTDAAIDYYFADIHWYTIKKGNTIPLTDEEKKDTLTWAMDKWIGGMMQACGGYVTSWDVVNEALSGADMDGDGKYDLQSATRGTVSEDDAKNNFYWQDYLGDDDYVRTAVRLARKNFAENGGEGDLRLFINDYNLESDWDDNAKAKSLKAWIEEWESDGVTRIDGVGTQMHISCYADAATQKSKKDHIVKMFEILASTGKLVKISELDMGYIDANGQTVKTQDLTQEQAKEMSELYKFVIAAYFAKVPSAQQYGITNWCITDAPAESGWRGGEPVGLWDSNYNRKHTYAGYADGLAGKGTISE